MKLAVHAVATEFWPEKLLAEVFWDGDVLVAKGDNEVAVHEVNERIRELYQAQQGFPTYARDPGGKLARDPKGKLVPTGFRSRATHSPEEVLEALADALESRGVYRVATVS